MFKKNRNHSVKVVIECAEHYKNVPYSIEIDFDELLRKKKIKGTFDRFSVIVKKIDGSTGDMSDIHFNLSDSFLTGNRGKVNWLIEDTEDKEYIILYDVKENGPYTPLEYIGLVGNGDCIRYNDGRLHPLHVGMHSNPIAVDWDGDGRIDLVTPQIYSHTVDSPWFPVRFFKNEGTNKNPFFGDGIPLRGINGGRFESLSCGCDIEVCDWNNDGLPDLLLYSYGYSGRDELQIYINTGKKDDMGLPLLELKHSLKVLPANALVTAIRVVDWFGDGRKSLVVGYIGEEELKLNIDDTLWFKASEEEKRNAQWPRWYYKSKIALIENLSHDSDNPDFKRPVTLRNGRGEEISYRTVSCLEVVDHGMDGKPDLLVLCDSEDLHRGYAGIEYYKNTGKENMTVFEPCGKLRDLRDRSSLYFRNVDTAAFKGLLVNHGSASGKIRYYEFNGYDNKGLPLYKDKGFVLQRNAYLNSYSGYAQGHLCDWDGDGDWDLVTGCETGFVLRSENTGTQKMPVFRELEFLRQGGEIIELLNGPFDDPGSIMEGVLGQTAPMYVDWDGDGILDLLVIVGRRLYYYRNTGTSESPEFCEPVEVRADGGQEVAKHRNKPAVIDWDGDGLQDIIGHDSGENGLYFFKRYRDEKTGELRLAKGIPLMYTDGTPVIPNVWHRYTKYFNAADWKNKGSYDIFLSTCDLILYLENAGTNEKPAFLRPVRVEADGKPIVIGHHVSTPFPVDWDKSGRYDLFVSGESGLFHLFRRNYLDGVHNKIKYRICDG